MEELFDPSNSLFCDENGEDLCFDDLDDVDEIKSEPLIHPPEQSDEGFFALLERENDYLPKHDYLNRLRSGDLDLCARKEAFHWIFKAHCYHSFGPLSLCLAVNYLDRFLSVRELPRDKDWTVQLLAVACLSIAAKIEETSMPLSLELQVGDPKYVFEAKTIQRMELLVLDTLQWKMNAVTPCSFLDYSLNQLSNHNPHSIIHKYLFSMTKVINRSMELILCTMKGIDYLEFKASEIAAAVAMSVAAEIQAVDIDKPTYCFTHLNKDRVLKCVEMIKEMLSQMNTSGLMQQGVPPSPIGVLDIACFSYRSDEFTSSHFGSSSNSSQITATASATPTAMPMTINSGTKRMKLDTPNHRLPSL
ncbi:cyclin-D4-1-like [Silene latifolia]|uniref:cyclin-D4-1-like n=1 Tax=Silene latifolia TaxID=37657 RepID=UPI003D77C361